MRLLFFKRKRLGENNGSIYREQYDSNQNDAAQDGGQTHSAYPIAQVITQCHHRHNSYYQLNNTYGQLQFRHSFLLGD
jgi:hypothetical protein